MAAPLLFAFGYALQHALLNRTLGRDILPPLLVTFGLSIIIQNGLLEVFSADSQRLAAGAIETASIPLGGGLAVGTMPLITFASAVAVILALNLLFYRTELGRAFRATSDDPEIAQLMGIDNRHIFSLAMAVAMVVIAVSALYLGMRANFDPTIGPARLLYAFEAVIIGGLGSFWGTLAGGIIIGVAQTVGAQHQSRVADPRRAPRLPGRAGAAAARPVSRAPAIEGGHGPARAMDGLAAAGGREPCSASGCAWARCAGRRTRGQLLASRRHARCQVSLEVATALALLRVAGCGLLALLIALPASPAAT